MSFAKEWYSCELKCVDCVWWTILADFIDVWFDFNLASIMANEWHNCQLECVDYVFDELYQQIR